MRDTIRTDPGTLRLFFSREWKPNSRRSLRPGLFEARYPDNPPEYRDRFVEMWHYIRSCLWDERYGGFYAGGVDRAPGQRDALKARVWKGPYRTTRALMNCIRIFGFK